VWANQNDPPSSTFLCLTTASGMAMRIEIDELPFTAKPTFWQKVANNIADKEGEDDSENMDYDCDEDDNKDTQTRSVGSFLGNRWTQKGWVEYTDADWKAWHGKCVPSATAGAAPVKFFSSPPELHSLSVNDDDNDGSNGGADQDEYMYPWDDIDWVDATDDLAAPVLHCKQELERQQQIDEAAREEQRRLSAEVDIERQRSQNALLLQQQQARAEAEAQQQLIAQQQQQLQQQQAAALAATAAATAAAEAAQQQQAQQQQVAAASSTTSALIAQMQAAQTEQDRRINQLTVAVDRTIADGSALTSLVQAQADSLAQLGGSVAKLTTNFETLNNTMALLLEKMTILTEEKQAKPPRNAENLRRPASPTPPGVVRERPEPEDDEDELAQPTGAQRARSSD
jgi:chemotaxis protein histidine kinase CheA